MSRVIKTNSEQGWSRISIDEPKQWSQKNILIVHEEQPWWGKMREELEQPYPDVVPTLFQLSIMNIRDKFRKSIWLDHVNEAFPQLPQKIRCEIYGRHDKDFALNWTTIKSYPSFTNETSHINKNGYIYQHNGHYYNLYGWREEYGYGSSLK